MYSGSGTFPLQNHVRTSFPHAKESAQITHCSQDIYVIIHTAIITENIIFYNHQLKIIHNYHYKYCNYFIIIDLL